MIANDVAQVLRNAKTAKSLLSLIQTEDIQPTKFFPTNN